MVHLILLLLGPLGPDPDLQKIKPRTIEQKRIPLKSGDAIELSVCYGGRIRRIGANGAKRWEMTFEVPRTKPFLPRAWLFGPFLIVEQVPAPTHRYPILGVRQDVDRIKTRAHEWRFRFLDLKTGKLRFDKAELDLGIPIRQMGKRFIFVKLMNPKEAFLGKPEVWRNVLRDSSLKVVRTWRAKSAPYQTAAYP